MSLIINEDCTCCDACVSECPNEAIAEAEDIYIIDATKCTECVGFFDSTQCAEVCPTEAILEGTAEDNATLIERAKSIHPDKEFAADCPTHKK